MERAWLGRALPLPKVKEKEKEEEPKQEEVPAQNVEPKQEEPTPQEAAQTEEVANPEEEANPEEVAKTEEDPKPQEEPKAVAVAAPGEAAQEGKTVTKLFVVYYSMYGHVAKLAEEILKGANSVEGVEATLYQVPETLPQEVLGKMHAPPKKEDVPILDVDKLPEADGYLFGFPTRYGNMAAQMKAFWDSTGQIWMKQQLAGKPCGFFFSTATQGGGQETTALCALPNLVHHGLIFVPIAYTFGPGMYEMSEIKGGSPYGAGTFANVDGSRQPSKLELEQAFHQGKYTAGITKKLKSAA